MELKDALEYFENQEFEKSLEILNEIIAISPTASNALKLRAKIYQKKQNWGKAINDYLIIEELEPENAEVKMNIEMCRNILGYFCKDLLNP